MSRPYVQKMGDIHPSTTSTTIRDNNSSEQENS